MNTTEVSRSDILLAIIAAANGKELSRVHLQKVAFLVSEEFKGRLPEDFYTFDKHDYGPFCIDIYNDTAMLDYWARIRTKRGAEGSDERYVISENVSFDRLQLDEDIKQYIKNTVAWVADMSFGQVVRAVYRLYPEYLERSTFEFDKEQAIHESFERSLKQLRDGQTTLADDFIDELRAAARENE
ncbi:MAG: hypothetical protein OXE52_11550 [Chloroflexi bacterium]|nr:hypothetical protein [Chloroflexota bacterium]